MGKTCAATFVIPCLMAGALLSAQQPPQPTQLPGNIFVIKNTWFIGGAGPWDYLTMDTAAHRLFIAHGRVVQVVDVETGALAGQVTGLQQAHDIALDPNGEFGYVSDGLSDQVKIFDRRSFQVVASVPTWPGPRALALDAQSGLLFVVCTTPLSEEPLAPATPAAAHPSQADSAQTKPRRNGRVPIRTSIAVIDVTRRKRIGEILVQGQLGFAQADGNGQLFVLMPESRQFARIDAGAVASLLHVPQGEAASTIPPVDDAADSAATKPVAEPAPPVLDWTGDLRQSESAQRALQVYGIDASCRNPQAFAIDGAHQRIFAACDNLRLMVLDSGTGQAVTTLPIGPGAQAVGYDAGRGLIYTANGDAQGTLTIIRQDVTDTYNVIQNLPTRQRARTLAVDPGTGQVFLVTDYAGVDLSRPGGIGTLKSTPVAGSFQVLVVGH